jgi:uncharacterized protein
MRRRSGTGVFAFQVDGFLRELANRDVALAGHCLAGAKPSNEVATAILDSLQTADPVHIARWKVTGLAATATATAAPAVPVMPVTRRQAQNGPMPRAVLVVLVVLLVTIVLMIMLLWVFQRRLIYLPSTAPVPSAERVLPGARDVTLRTADGIALGAWLVPPRGRDREVTVLVANGNAGDRSLRAPLATALAQQGLTVLLFDYRGYGGNPGSPTEPGLALDVRAAYQFLVEQAGVPPDRLLFYGESLGAAVVTELASERPPAGLVLRSPFVDLAAVGRVHYPFLPVGALLKDRFPVVEHIARVDVPVTIVYGTRDTIVPPEQSRAVAAAAPGPARTVEIPGADHNDRALLDGQQLVNAVVELAPTG